MEERIEGSWPGGPRRSGDPKGSARGPRQAPRLRRAEDIDAAIMARPFRRSRRARARRVAVGLSFSVALAGGVGWVMGRMSRTTASELTEQVMQARLVDKAISSEVNRTLLELWKMEDVEAGRNMGLRR